MNDEYGYVEEEINEEPTIAPPVSVPRQWSWNTETLLWSALGVVGVSFIVWFLMAFTGARARAIAEELSNGDGAGN